MKRYRIIALIYIVLLFGGLLGSLTLTGHYFADFTSAEGRIGAKTEAALRQNLPLRDALKQWKTTLLMLGGVQETDGIYFTGEGLIENLTVADETLGEKNLAALQDYCRATEPYVLLLPSACAISSDLLPEAALLFDQESWLGNAVSALSPLCSEVQNGYPLLQEHSGSRLFYRTDSRPTQLTGYLLYRALAPALDYYPYAKDHFTNTPLRYDCTGDLYARWSYDKVRPDVVTALLPLSDPRSYTVTHTAADGAVRSFSTLYPLEGTTGMDCILGGPAACITVSAEGSISRSLLLLGDENALCVIPYLALHYGSITYVDVTRCTPDLLSTVAARNAGREQFPEEGMSHLRGTDVTLKSVLESDTEGYLGKGAAQPTLGVLTKLIDSAERLTLQVHPDRPTALRLFQSQYGKTECWHILSGHPVNGEEPCIYYGFQPDMTRARWEALFHAQDIPGMLAGMQKYPVHPGDTILIEGGMPHAIGAGCFLVEIQEPTDYTIRVERTTPSGFAVADSMCHQGLGFEKMFECFHYEPHSREEIHDRWFIEPETVLKTAGGSITTLVGYRNTPLFRLDEVNVSDTLTVDCPPCGSGIYVLEGAGTLSANGRSLPLKKTDQLFVPAGTGRFTLDAEAPLRVLHFFGPEKKK